jgi:hypothetical protein
MLGQRLVERRHEGQEFLIARDTLGCLNHIIGAIGDMAIWLADDARADLFSVDGWAFDDRPMEPGLWVWTGQITYKKERPGPWFRFHDGSWRPALLNDFVRFGLPVPLPRIPEGGLHG